MCCPSIHSSELLTRLCSVVKNLTSAQARMFSSLNYHVTGKQHINDALRMLVRLLKGCKISHGLGVKITYPLLRPLKEASGVNLKRLAGGEVFTNNLF